MLYFSIVSLSIIDWTKNSEENARYFLLSSFWGSGRCLGPAAGACREWLSDLGPTGSAAFKPREVRQNHAARSGDSITGVRLHVTSPRESIANLLPNRLGVKGLRRASDRQALASNGLKQRREAFRGELNTKTRIFNYLLPLIVKIPSVPALLPLVIPASPHVIPACH